MEKKLDGTQLAPGSAGERLQRLRQANGCIVYYHELPDPEYPHVKCSIYGAPKTNELFVELTNGVVAFVAAAPSPVLYPAMLDRIFGIDAQDHTVAFGMADQLWLNHREVLIGSAVARKDSRK